MNFFPLFLFPSLQIASAQSNRVNATIFCLNPESNSTNLCCSLQRNPSGGTAIEPSCSKLLECARRDIHLGKLSLSCLVRPDHNSHSAVSSNMPYMRLVSHGGFGIGIDRHVQAKPGPRRRGLGIVAPTEILFNLDVLRKAGFNAVRFAATGQLAGPKDYCAQHKISIRFRIIAATGRANGSSSSRRRCRTPLSTVLSYAKAHNGYAKRSKVMSILLTDVHKKLRLITSVHGLPSDRKLRKAILGHCAKAFWGRARLEAATEASACRSDCGMYIGCLLKDKAKLSVRDNHTLHYPYATVASKVEMERHKKPTEPLALFTPYSSVSAPNHRSSESQAATSRYKDSQPADSVSVVSSESGEILSFKGNTSITINLRKFRKQGWVFDLFTGRVGVEPSTNSSIAQCRSLVSNLTASVAKFFVFVDDILKLERTLPFIKTRQEENAENFVVGLWQTQASKLKIEVQSALPRSCMMSVWQGAKLQREGRPRLSSCQSDCLRGQATHGQIYLSCFLGGCSNTSTMSSFLPYTRVVAANRHIQIGIDRPGRGMSGNGSISLGRAYSHKVFRYHRGIGAHPTTQIQFNLTAFRLHGLQFTYFSAVLGVDMHAAGCHHSRLGGARFKVAIDGHLKLDKETYHAWDTHRVMIDVSRAELLELSTLAPRAQPEEKSWHCLKPAVWADAMLHSPVHHGQQI